VGGDCLVVFWSGPACKGLYIGRDVLGGAAREEGLSGGLFWSACPLLGRQLRGVGVVGGGDWEGERGGLRTALSSLVFWLKPFRVI